MVVAKKKATRKVVAKKKTVVKKTIPPKPIKPKSVKTRKQIALLVNQNKKEQLAVLKKTDIANELAMNDWAGRLVLTKAKMEKLNKKYEELLLVLLNDAYSVYREVIKTDLADDFFSALWNELYKEGIKVQRNTPNASLVIRYICGTTISTKTVSNYAKVLEGADYNNIKSEQFVAWVQHKTQTKIIEDQRNIENNVETRAKKMARARAVIMRLIEARETKPEFSWKTTAGQAEKMIGRDGLWIGVGNATRRMDRESFYADLNLTMFLPPNIDIEFYIINALAKQIVDNVGEYEEKITTLEESVWGDELWEKLTSAGFEESDRVSEWWSNKQQASRFESQQDFIEEVVKPKKQARKKKVN